MLKFRCKECDQKIGVPEEWAGRNVRCPRCRHAVPVPKVIDAIVQPGIARRQAKPIAPVTPKAPLTPMPPLKGRTVAVPHPAVRPKAVSVPGAKTVNLRVGAESVEKNKPQQATPSLREHAPLPEPAGRAEPETTSDEVAASPRIDASPESEAAPEPVIVSARRTTAEPIVTEVPGEKDFSSLFSDVEPRGVGPADVAPQGVAPVEAATVDVPVATGRVETPPNELIVQVSIAPISGAPFTEMMDALGGPEELGVTSSATVSDIVKGLTPGSAEKLLGGTSDESRRSAPATVRRSSQREVAVGNGWVWVTGSIAMSLGVVALAFCVTPRVTRFALPVGAFGLIVAVVGAVLPARRRGTEVALALGSSGISTLGVALAILVAMGVVPSAATSHTGSLRASAMPAARVGDVEVRVASASIVRPVVFTKDRKTRTADTQPCLQVGIEVRNLAKGRNLAYKTWGAARADLEPVILLDDEGNQLKLRDPAPEVPRGRPSEYPATIAGNSHGVSDVLLFDVPPAAVHELYLQLPGSNVQTPGGFNIQIPASMLRRQ